MKKMMIAEIIPIICSVMTLMKMLLENMNSKSGRKPLLKNTQTETKSVMSRKGNINQNEKSRAV